MPSRRYSDRHPKAYFEAACSYRATADELLAILETKEPTERQPPAEDPTYFLYAHAVELALKACLLSHGHPIENGHHISAYYDECRTAKLIEIKDRKFQGCIALLDAGNEIPLHRYRYPGKVTNFVPTLGMTREVVGQLLEAVEPHVNAWVKAHPTTPAPTTTRMSLGEPEYRRQPTPSKKGP
jgi:hypothetical protein